MRKKNPGADFMVNLGPACFTLVIMFSFETELYSLKMNFKGRLRS